VSLVDEARSVRERVVERLAELEPLVREYEELSRLAAELGVDRAAPARSSAAPQDARPRSSGARVARGPSQRAKTKPTVEPQRRDIRGTGGAQATQLLEAVRSSPGATVAEIASTIGVTAASLYRPVRQLTSDGALVKRGRRLFPSEVG
jgi:hypothetical protein